MTDETYTNNDTAFAALSVYLGGLENKVQDRKK
jgi:hypothetical protein